MKDLGGGTPPIFKNTERNIMKSKKIIGILGGMGPSASGYLYNLMNSLAVKEYGVKKNDEFPETILYSVPVPDFISSTRNKSKALAMLKRRVKSLDTLPIGVFGIACNTAHILLPELQKQSKTRFISMIDAVVGEVSKKGFKTVGILATSSTMQANLYQKSLKIKGVDVIVPTKRDQESLDEIIKSTVGERAGRKDEKKLFSIAGTLKAKGADVIILGCTELPLLFPRDYSLPIFNSVEILSRALLKECTRVHPARKI